jgi:hypothetical protein
MPARRATSLCVPVDGRSAAEAVCYRSRSPLFTLRAGRPALLVTLTVPDRVEAGHVAFARQLATSAAAFAVEVERRFRGLPTTAPAPLASPPGQWRQGGLEELGEVAS